MPSSNNKKSLLIISTQYDYYSEKIKPTRKNVLNNQQLSLIYGGVNYFPFNPVNLDIEALDKLLFNFTDEDYYSVNLNLFTTGISHI